VYREVLNTDASAYAGSGVGNLGRVAPDSEPCHGRRQSVLLELPPLGALYLAPERAT
jgi:1,4-alpha-glucan branching enzyme